MANNVQLGDILVTARNFSAQPSLNGRFPDTLLVDNINNALEQVMLDVEWPEATWYFQTDGIHASFALPDMQSLLRVYVAGQACPPTSRPILEGNYIGLYDSSGPYYTPQWTQAPFTGYPVAQDLSAPTTVGSLPYFVGQRPGYFPLLGGTAIGIVPPPTAGWIVALDCYPAITPLSLGPDPTDYTSGVYQTFYPNRFKEALALRTLMYCFFAMGGAASQQLEAAAAGYKEQQQKLRDWKQTLFKSLPQPTYMPVPHRTYFRGPYRGPTGPCSRMGS